MNEIINSIVGIKFRPLDENIGIPIKMLDSIEKKTIAEELSDEEIEKIKQDNNFDDSFNVEKVTKLYDFFIKRIREKNGCMIEYRFLYKDGWYKLEKYNCEMIEEEIDFIQEYVKNVCAPIQLIIKVIQVD